MTKRNDDEHHNNTMKKLKRLYNQKRYSSIVN